MFITFFLVNARGCHFLGSKPVDSSYLSARLFARLPLYPLAASFGLFCSERLFACVDSAPWRYLLIRLLAMFLLIFGAVKIIIIYRTSRCYQIYDFILFYFPPSRRYSALRPRPLTEIDFLFASRRMSILFFLRPLMARLGFIPIRA